MSELTEEKLADIEAEPEKYRHTDVIAALVAEVRRLWEEAQSEIVEEQRQQLEQVRECTADSRTSNELAGIRVKALCSRLEEVWSKSLAATEEDDD